MIQCIQSISMPKTTNLPIHEESKIKRPFIIGVAGGSGSGKTTFAQEILHQIPSNLVAHMTHDSYYKDQSHLEFEERTKTNYDHPNSLETELLVSHIHKLLVGESIEHPTYDYTLHTRAKETKRVDPKPILLIEGILIFAEPALCELFDLKIFVDTEGDLRLARRLLRDVAERGRTFEYGIEQFLTFTKPMHDQFVEPSKRFADIIIPEGGLNTVANSVIRAHISSILSEM